AAHAASLGRDRAEVAWALSGAVTDTLEHIVDAAAVGDPVAGVAAARTGATRHRRTRAAALAVALAVAVAAGVVLAWPGAATRGASALDRGSPAWATVSRWPPRGPLVDDPTVRSVAADA